MIEPKYHLRHHLKRSVCYVPQYRREMDLSETRLAAGLNEEDVHSFATWTKGLLHPMSL